jgi:predicted enzyme related to lactoylglutathione lyase
MANALVQGLGWFVRRTAKDPFKLADFYESAFGMRTVRPPAPPPLRNKMLWSGDILMFELSARETDAEGDERIADMTPILRARNFDAAKSQALAAGAILVEDAPGPRFARFRDPDGFHIAISKPPAQSPYPSDRMAETLRRDGVLELPGIETFGPNLQDMAGVTVKVADPAAMAAFYADVLGLETFVPASASGAVLGFGRTSALILRPGGQRRPTPRDRAIVPDVWILRVRDVAAMGDRLKAKRVTIVNEMSITGGRLIYAADPEGRLFGLQQRTADLLPKDTPARIEDRTIWGLG